MQAIETNWRGYRFRSRTEARWAVFFTHAGVKFSYEPEGYALPSGWYLPDFWLPDVGCFLEIKGVYPTVREVRLAWELTIAANSPIAFAIGSPLDDFIEFPVPEADYSGNQDLGYNPLWNDIGNVATRPIDLALDAVRGERFDGREPARTVRQARAEERARRWWW